MFDSREEIEVRGVEFPEKGRDVRDHYWSVVSARVKAACGVFSLGWGCSVSELLSGEA